eukprot:PhF_6_TR17077/c0_g1_i3/m.26188
MRYQSCILLLVLCYSTLLTDSARIYVNHQSSIFSIATPAVATTFTGFTVVIQSGSVTGDQLYLSPITGWTITWTASTWILLVKAPSAQSAAAMTSVFNQVTFFTSSYSTTAVRTIGWTWFSGSGAAIYYPANGHYYEIVLNGVSLTWAQAKTNCAARTMQGKTGYLTTLTSQAEYDFFNSVVSGSGYLGGSDATTEGTWKWETGPEAGTIFYQGGVCLTFCKWGA